MTRGGHAPLRQAGIPSVRARAGRVISSRRVRARVEEGEEGARAGQEKAAEDGGGQPPVLETVLIAAPAMLGTDVHEALAGVQALAVLAGILAVHEGGHFAMARALSIHVSKFSIGFGPAVANFEHDGVDYSLRALPLGGYVGFPDDDDDKPYDDDDPDLLTNRPVTDRAAVASAGIAANIVCAAAVIVAQVSTIGLFDFSYEPGVRVPSVVEDSAADRAGLRGGDVVLAVDGHALAANSGAVRDFMNGVGTKPGDRTPITVRHADGSKVELSLVVDDAPAPGKGRLGVTLEPNSFPTNSKPANAADVVRMSAKSFMDLFGGVTKGLSKVVTSPDTAMDSLSGPVAVVAIGAEVARGGNGGIYQFAAAINVNLAVWNALPLPALDGGYLALFAIEALRGKRMPKDMERSIMSSGLLVFLTLGIVLVVRDTAALM